jgi:nicotinamide-nucleotide amidase
MNLEDLAQQVIEQAKVSDVTIVTAESCTAGALAHTLSKAPGAGDHLEGGFVTYTKDMKSDALGVSMKLLKAKSAVCEEVAQAMAIGALKRSPADIAIAITGVAGPEPDEDGNPVGLVYIAAARIGGKTVSARHMFENKSREDILTAATEQALLLLKQVGSH